jgi:hypothetical protein
MLHLLADPKGMAEARTRAGGGVAVRALASSADRPGPSPVAVTPGVGIRRVGSARGPHLNQGTTLIFFDACQAAEWVGSDSARSVPPSSSAMVNVTLGAENTGWR